MRPQSCKDTCFAERILYSQVTEVNGQKKLAACFATLPQNEMKSDFARFTNHESNLS